MSWAQQPATSPRMRVDVEAARYPSLSLPVLLRQGLCVNADFFCHRGLRRARDIAENEAACAPLCVRLCATVTFG